MKFNEWLEKRQQVDEGAIGYAVFAALQALWQYYGGAEMSPATEEFMNRAIYWLSQKFHLAEPQAMFYVKQFMCKMGRC